MPSIMAINNAPGEGNKCFITVYALIYSSYNDGIVEHD